MEINVNMVEGLVKEVTKEKLPIVLVILIYILLYLIRLQQGGWEVQLDLFPQIREDLDQKIEKLLPPPQAQLLSGILLGEKKNLPPQFKLALRDTSTLHIVVASGQNLSIVAGFFWYLAGLIKRKTALSLSFLAIIFYTLLTGFQVPVLRAAIMLALTMVAQIVGRAKDSWWVLAVTAGLMLLINPQWILDLSFQLSFLATLGVIVVAPILLRYLTWLPVIGQDLAVTVAAQVMVIPIIAQNFHQISVVGVITNLMVLWTISFIMILGFTVLAVVFISHFIAQIMAILVGSLLTYFIYIVNFFASLAFAWEYVGEQSWLVWIGYYLVVAAILIALKKWEVRNEDSTSHIKNSNML